MHNFRAIAREFVANGACIQVADADGLQRSLQELLENSERRQAISAAAHRVIQSNVGATDRCTELIANRLSPSRP
jgi:3-deoxy-D-manno-octulosonic-acid transferase